MTLSCSERRSDEGSNAHSPPDAENDGVIYCVRISYNSGREGFTEAIFPQLFTLQEIPPKLMYFRELSSFKFDEVRASSCKFSEVRG